MMWSLLYNPSTNSFTWLLTPAWSIIILQLPQLICAWFTNWKSHQISDFKQSFRHLPPLEMQSWKLPCVWNSKLHYPHATRISVQETPLFVSEFQDAARVMAWIFSRIAHLWIMLWAAVLSNLTHLRVKPPSRWSHLKTKKVLKDWEEQLTTSQSLYLISMSYAYQ